MGMLQLKGVVSGFGKGLQQGLQQTQQYMSQSLLLEERDKNERDRMKLTFAHDEGMLQKRAAVEETAADKLHSRTLDRDERREDFEMRKGRIERDAARTDEATKYERQKERDAKTQENTVTNKVLDASYEQQKDATKAKQDRAKEERTRQAEREKQQGDIAKEIVTETIRNQRPHAGGSSSNAEVTAQLKIVTDEIRGLEHQILNTFDDKEKARLQKQLDAKLAERRALGGMPSSQPSRPQYRFPE